VDDTDPIQAGEDEEWDLDAAEGPTEPPPTDG